MVLAGWGSGHLRLFGIPSGRLLAEVSGAWSHKSCPPFYGNIMAKPAHFFILESFGFFCETEICTQLSVYHVFVSCMLEVVSAYYDGPGRVVRRPAGVGPQRLDHGHGPGQPERPAAHLR